MVLLLFYNCFFSHLHSERNISTLDKRKIKSREVNVDQLKKENVQWCHLLVPYNPSHSEYLCNFMKSRGKSDVYKIVENSWISALVQHLTVHLLILLKKIYWGNISIHDILKHMKWLLAFLSFYKFIYFWWSKGGMHYLCLRVFAANEVLSLIEN